MLASDIANMLEVLLQQGRNSKSFFVDVVLLTRQDSSVNSSRPARSCVSV